MGIFKKKNNDNEKQDMYAREVDQTRYLVFMFILAMTAVLSFVGMEIFLTDDHKMQIFTPEITHIVVNALLIGFVGTGSFVYGKSAGANEALAKMMGQNGGGNGGNGTTKNQEENKQ